MSVTAIRARAARYAWTRRASYLFGFALLAFEVVMFGRFALTATNPGARVGLLAILVGLGWATALFSLGWPKRLPEADASGQALLEFHRGELQRQRLGFSRLMFVVGPLIGGILVFVFAAGAYAPHPSFTRGWPVLAGLALWMVVAWFLARRAEGVRKRRLAEIDATRPE